MKRTIESWKYGLAGALVISGAIAFSEGYAFAQTFCPLGQVSCKNVTIKWPRNGPDPNAISLPQSEIDELQRLYPQAIQQLRQEDPQAIEKLRALDPQTVDKLQQLAPKSRQQLKRYTQHVIQQQPNQPAIENQHR